MKSKDNIWQYRKIIGLMRSRVDRCQCTTSEIIEYMKEVHGHDSRPNELERALMKSNRIHKIGTTKYNGRMVSIWGSDWNK
jgi:hypothetical protein